MTESKHINVRPDAVRVWRGFMLDKFRRSKNGPEKFRQTLRELFLPITAQAMAPLGLTAYLPTIMKEDKCPTLPHEIALVFYKSQDAYKKAMQTTMGKAYGMLHGCVFNFDRNIEDLPYSTSSFPVILDAEFNPDTPYYLYDKELDWHHGQTGLFVGIRKTAEPAEFLTMIHKAMQELQKNPPPGLNQLILVASYDYLIFWTHGEKLSALHKQLLQDLRSEMRKVIYRTAKRLDLAAVMYDPIEEVPAATNQPAQFNFPRLADINAKENPNA